MTSERSIEGRHENLPEGAYHDMTDYLGSSTLAQMRKSPLHFKTAWSRPVEPTTAMDIGTFIHRVVLEQDIACYVKRPVKEDGSLVRSNSKEYQAFLASVEGKRVVAPELHDAAGEILNSVCNHRMFLAMFEAADPEVSYFGTHQATGQKIKARMDLLAKDRSFILDVKTTSNIERFERQVFDLGYDVRLAHYNVTLASVEKDLRQAPAFFFFAIESAPPFGCKLFKLGIEDQSAAVRTWCQWMNELKACRDDDKWPGYSEKVFDLKRPAFLQRVEEPDFGKE